jgi:hypothetical protein
VTRRTRRDAGCMMRDARCEATMTTTVSIRRSYSNANPNSKFQQTMTHPNPNPTNKQTTKQPNTGEIQQVPTLTMWQSSTRRGSRLTTEQTRETGPQDGAGGRRSEAAIRRQVPDGGINRLAGDRNTGSGGNSVRARGLRRVRRSGGRRRWGTGGQTGQS